MWGEFITDDDFVCCDDGNCCDDNDNLLCYNEDCWDEYVEGEYCDVEEL